ncbi:MAG: YbdD/YjiX family protein [Thermoflavifilum sp.]|nr:YbdD/YjiX family protein [Thermoflavifilum sp.]MCL6514657.1 YbdD/YjiX family protein [Alicyclobacillus sp.]
MRMAFREWMRRASTEIKTIFGMPNYERYLEHHRKVHPDQPVMSEREYYLHCLKERYESGKVSRCC